MKPKPPSSAAELRRRAEGRLQERQNKQKPAAGGRPSEVDNQRLLHELQVHQIELEMQNENLLLARDKAESAREKFSDLYDFAPVGYLTLDHDGAIYEANLTCASLFGLERARLIKRRLATFIATPDRSAFNEFLQKVFAGQTLEASEVVLAKEEKSPVTVRIRAVRDASGQTCRVAITDITESKRAEADRLVLSKLESTGILAGGLAHDFNNLLTTILINLELGGERATTDTELAQNLAAAKKATLAARVLTQQLIIFAVGGAAIREPVALPALIRESIAVALSGSRLRCEFNLADDLRLVAADAGQISQVIRNLVQNAREAMPEGGVIRVQARNVQLDGREPAGLPPGEYVMVSLADQGGGITKELRAKIFDPYFSTKQRGEQKGMGLGLTICHTILKKHGGAIQVESAAGAGTTFTFYLPATRHPLPSPPAVPLKKYSTRPSRVLVMDDEEALRVVIGKTLQQMGHDVELAADGQQAVKIYRQAQEQGRPFDVVILDLTVRGGLGGREALALLLQLGPTVKAIVMSGYTTDPVLLEYQRHGFKGMLEKPFEVAKLQEIFSRVLAG